MTRLTIPAVGLIVALMSGLRGQEKYIRCYTVEHDRLMRARYADWPGMDEYEEVLKEQIERYKAHLAQARTIGGVYRIPVVVHVIHDGEAVGSGRNISDAQILSQIAVLNEDFRRMSGTRGWNNHPRGADVQIEFVLAKRTPSGSATNGIVRWNRRNYGWTAPPYTTSYIDQTIKPATQWDPNLYLNIWVCDIQGGILGYAQFPDLSGLLGLPGDAGNGACTQASSTDGVVIWYKAFGSSEKGNFPVLQAPYNLGRTTTHEVGHWLGLRHTWGDGECSVDDFCDDTPLCSNPVYGCPSSAASCLSGVSRMVQNYMEYTDDACMNIFTIDQATRMRIVIESCPRRRSLVTSPALVPPYSTDAAVIHVTGPRDACPGSYNFVATLRNNGTTTLTSVPIAYRVGSGSWQTHTWTGTLSPGASTNVTLPAINFSTTGNYTLTVCSNLANDPDRTEDTIFTQVRIHNGFYPLSQDFEAFQNRPIPPSLWWVSNPNNDCYTWRPAHCVGASGSRTTAMYINLYQYSTTGRRDELYSPLIDLRSAPSTVTLTFHVAYRPYNSSSTDELRVEISTDCGRTWSTTPIYRKAGSTLATGTPTTTRYIPSAASEWRKETVSLAPYRGQVIRLRFVSINQYGNNIWLDNIQVSAPATRLDNTEESFSFEESARVSFYAENPWQGPLRVWNGEAIQGLRLWSMEGQCVWHSPTTLPAGNHEFDLSHLPAGFYIVEWVGINGSPLMRQKLWRIP